MASTGGFLLGLALGPDALYACDLALPGLWRLDLGTGTLDRFGDRRSRVTRWSTRTTRCCCRTAALLVSDSGRAGEPRVGLLRYDPDGRGEVWLDEPLNFANGLALEPGPPDALHRRVVGLPDRRGRRRRADGRGRPARSAPTRRRPGSSWTGSPVDPDGVLYVGAYEPSAVLRIPAAGRVEVFAHDETAHLLCHPTNLAFRGRELVVANLGRWHLTGFDLGPR